MKKFLSIVVALAMVLSMTCIAFADVTVASDDAPENGVISFLEGADFTDETLYLYIYFTLNDSSKAGWGPAGLCSADDWSVNCIGYESPGGYELSANTDGYVCYSLPDIAAAFEAAGFDANNGVVLNWWEADYATLTGIALVSTDDNYVVAETTEETSEEASAEVTETVEETNSEEASSASPSTGVALALVPMAIAGIAVVSTKRR